MVEVVHVGGAMCWWCYVVVVVCGDGGTWW